MDYKVYKIQRIDTKEVVYIGITKCKLQNRLYRHFSEIKHNKKKINYFSKYKKFLEIKLIQDEIKNIQEAKSLEINYIKEFKDIGCNLLNATDGGDYTKNNTSWNKGLKCSYIDKLENNSPNAKKVYMYDSNGVYIKDFNSIKKANEENKIPRQAIKYMCELKIGYILYKNLTFRYFKSDKINIEKMSKQEKVNRIVKSRINNMKKVIIFDKVNNKKYIFKNIIECLKNFNIKKETLQVYLTISKETLKYKFSYE
jgi:Uri superfamily endonuclease